MRKLAGCLLLSFGLASLLLADVTIIGPRVVPEHSLAELKASGGDEGAVYSWKVSGLSPSYKGVGEYLLLTGKPGVYRVYLITSSIKGGKIHVEESETEVIIGKLEPVPNPDDGGKPEPGPQPIPSKAWIIVVEETALAAAERGKYFSDKDLIGYVRSKGWKLRITDKDVVDKDGKQPTDLVPYLKRAQGKELPQTYVVSDKGVVLFENKLHKSPADFLSLLKKLGGDAK